MNRLLILAILLQPLASPGGDKIEFCTQSRDRATGQPSLAAHSWDPAGTALIICDMWDSHHSGNAAKRTAELAPRLDRLASSVRKLGGLVIHAPSGTMDFYRDHPARNRAIGLPEAADLPADIGSWCHWKDGLEESIGYPIDHSDGGADDTPEELERWHEKLRAQGREVRSPWRCQIPSISIDPEDDVISDSGVEIWNLLSQRDIDNVLLAGVHTNMCVLGRPFGLRQLSRNGKNVVLVRDLTDTMYNPEKRPFVSHFQGTDLVIGHIEQHVCPTVSSDQLLDGSPPFHFREDTRKRLVAMIGEAEYQTEKTLPRFLEHNLRDDFRVDYVLADPGNKNEFFQTGKITHADVLVISVRRRTLPEHQLELVKSHVAAGKPLVAIRTASHAFALREGQPPQGQAVWPEFDSSVLGGNYQGHHGNELRTTAVLAELDHPVLHGLKKQQPFETGGSLYINTPVGPNTTVLATGKADSIGREEPVAWVNTPASGNRVFYTSLGHPDDFGSENFTKLLSNAVRWAAKVDPATGSPAASER